jgi:biofilm PGA synthesis N-glycosyltransferase PgaC
VVALFYGSYYLVLRLAMHLRPMVRRQTVVEYLPITSIIIPTYNEARTIGAMLRNSLDLDYPKGKLEIIVVDGASEDETLNIVKKYVDDGLVKLVAQQKRSGWNNAVREGLLHASGQVVVLSGSEVFYERQAMIRLCVHFADPLVGAAVGRQVLYNADESLATRMEREYRIPQDFISEAESRLDQPFDAKGEIVAVRRWILEKAIDRLENRAGGTLDACIPFETKAQHMKLVFEPEANYSEYTPSSIQERLEMQVRRGKHLIESTLPYLWMTWNPSFGSFGVLIFPFHLLMIAAFPWILLVGLVSFSLAVASHPLCLVILIPSIVLSLSKKGRALLSSFVLAQISLVLAMCTIVIRKNLPIKRIDSTRRIPARVTNQA